MNKQSKVNYKYIFMLFIIFMFLFPNGKVYAEQYVKNGKTYNYVSSDDGTDGPDTTTLEYELTYYGGAPLGSGVDINELTMNPKYGWYEYSVNGENYVVIATATHEMLKASAGKTGAYWFWGAKFNHIHYFNYKDTIQFKFEDQNFDPNVYNAIVLDTCGASMCPPIYDRNGEINIIDVYFGVDGETSTRGSAITGKKVYVTTTGVFSQKASQGPTNLGELFLEILKSIFTLFGDVIQTLLDLTDSNNTYGDKIEYTKEEILENSDLNNEIQFVSATDENSTNVDLSKITKEIDISSTLTNSNDQTESIYTTNTKIPVIPVDAYSSSIDLIDILDIDFFRTSNNQDSFWGIIRNFVSATSHIILYIVTAGLIAMLIIRSIILVTSIFNDDPQRAARSRNIIDRFVRAIVLIIGIYLIMTGITYLYSQILNIILNGNLQRYAIRVNVENVYSFNTNLIGYIKYLTLSSNIISSFVYSIAYFVFAVINLIWFVCMFLRMLIIAMFIIIAPITAIVYMTDLVPTGRFGLGNFFHFRNWLVLYTSIVFVPIIMLILEKVAIFIA